MMVNEQRKLNRQYYIARHRCAYCGRQDEYTLAGRTRCYTCAEKDRLQHQKKRNTKAEVLKEQQAGKNRRERRKELGLCVICGKRNATDGYVRCEYCRAEESRRRHQCRDVNVNYPRGDNGICWQCNKCSVVQGKNLCPHCYTMKVNILEQARPERQGEDHPWRRITLAQTIGKNSLNQKSV